MRYKILSAIVLALLFVISFAAFQYYQKTKSKKLNENLTILMEEQNKRYYKEFKKYVDTLNTEMDKALKIQFISISNGVISFQVLNKTDQNFRSIGFECNTRDGFGDHIYLLNSNFKYIANDPTELIFPEKMQYLEFEISYIDDYNDYKFKESLTFECRVKTITLSNKNIIEKRFGPDHSSNVLCDANCWIRQITLIKNKINYLRE